MNIQKKIQIEELKFTNLDIDKNNELDLILYQI